MYWLEVSVLTDGEGAEAVAEALRPYAHNEGVVLEQLGLAADPTPDALETAVTVKIYIPEDNDTPELRRRLEEMIYHMGRLYPLPPPTFRQLVDEDWANAWKDHYHPFRVGRRIWIQPSWLDVADTAVSGSTIQPDDVMLVLDPGMAFGTGTHPTTQMCLQALENLVQPGMRVFDVGTGSGILAIAAAKLGAAALLGIDTDEVAVKTAADNAAQNGVIDPLTLRTGTLDTVSERGWDIVVVNILAPIIIALFAEDDLMGYVAENGRLVLSGIIEEQGADVEQAIAAANGRVVQKMQMGDWVSYVVGHDR